MAGFISGGEQRILRAASRRWGRRGRRGPDIDFADAVHFDDCETSGLYKQGRRLRVYRDVVMEGATSQYQGMDNEGNSQNGGG